MITVPEYQYPMLVTFDDITDPASVRLVDPSNLAASFGPGVRLKSVTLEVTDEAVTAGVVENVLECIKRQHSCVQLDQSIPYGDPMRHVPNNIFSRRSE